MPETDPDDSSLYCSSTMPSRTTEKSLTAGRPIFDDIEMCEIRSPGSKNVKVFPGHRILALGSTTPNRWQSRSDLRRALPPAVPAIQVACGADQERHAARLCARSSPRPPRRTAGAEHLHGRGARRIDGQELKNLGPGGREMKNQAHGIHRGEQESAPNTQMQAELEVLRAAQRRAGGRSCKLKQNAEPHEPAEFDGMIAGAVARVHHRQHRTRAVGQRHEPQEPAAHGAGCATGEGGCMTLLSVVRDVCAAVGVPSRSRVFSSITGNRTMQEMVSLANEMAQRIAYDNRDWTRLKKTQTYIGDGVTTAFDSARQLQAHAADVECLALDLDADADDVRSRHRRMAEPPRPRVKQRQRRVDDDRRADAHLPGDGGRQTAYFAYLDKNCVALAGGGYGDSFLTDARQFHT